MVTSFRLKILLSILVAEITMGIAFFLFNPFLNKEIIYDAGPSFIPELLTWQENGLPAPWSPRDSHALVEYNGKLWLMAGLNANGFVIRKGAVEYWKAPHFSDVWNSRNGLIWNLVTEAAPWGKRRSAAAIDFQNKIWLMGGWGPKIGLKSDVWNSEDGLNWKRAVSAAAWPAREGHQVISFNDKLWLMGGVDYDSRETKNDVWYSSDGINWTQATAAAPWSGRWDHAVTVFQGKLWLIGGMDLNDGGFKDGWSSEDGSNWTMVTDNPPWQARQGHEILVFQDKLWLMGRFNDVENGGENDIWFSEDGLTWKKTNNNPEWFGREDSTAVVFKDAIWLMGGMDKNWTWRNDIWYSKN